MARKKTNSALKKSRPTDRANVAQQTKNCTTSFVAHQPTPGDTQEYSCIERHSQKVYREEDGGVHYDQVIDECKKKHLDNTEYWSVEMKKDFVKAPHWSIEKWTSVLAKKWKTKEKVSILLESELSSSIPVPSSNPRTFRKYNQSCIARQCTVTRRF